MVWYPTIVIDKYECDDISLFTGKYWELVRPSLDDLEYIDEVVGVINVRIKDLSVLPLLLKRKQKLRISETRLKGETKHYFMCLGTPIHSAPTKQITAEKRAFIYLQYLAREDKQLRYNLEEHDKLSQDKCCFFG